MVGTFLGDLPPLPGQTARQGGFPSKSGQGSASFQTGGQGSASLQTGGQESASLQTGGQGSASHQTGGQGSASLHTGGQGRMDGSPARQKALQRGQLSSQLGGLPGKPGQGSDSLQITEHMTRSPRRNIGPQKDLSRQFVGTAGQGPDAFQMEKSPRRRIGPNEDLLSSQLSGIPGQGSDLLDMEKSPGRRIGPNKDLLSQLSGLPGMSGQSSESLQMDRPQRPRIGPHRDLHPAQLSGHLGRPGQSSDSPRRRLSPHLDLNPQEHQEAEMLTMSGHTTGPMNGHGMIDGPIIHGQGLTVGPSGHVIGPRRGQLPGIGSGRTDGRPGNMGGMPRLTDSSGPGITDINPALMARYQGEDGVTGHNQEEDILVPGRQKQFQPTHGVNMSSMSGHMAGREMMGCNPVMRPPGKQLGRYPNQCDQGFTINEQIPQEEENIGNYYLNQKAATKKTDGKKKKDKKGKKKELEPEPTFHASAVLAPLRHTIAPSPAFRELKVLPPLRSTRPPPPGLDEILGKSEPPKSDISTPSSTPQKVELTQRHLDEIYNDTPIRAAAESNSHSSHSEDGSLSYVPTEDEDERMSYVSHSENRSISYVPTEDENERMSYVPTEAEDEEVSYVPSIEDEEVNYVPDIEDEAVSYDIPEAHNQLDTLQVPQKFDPKKAKEMEQNMAEMERKIAEVTNKLLKIQHKKKVPEQCDLETVQQKEELVADIKIKEILKENHKPPEAVKQSELEIVEEKEPLLADMEKKKILEVNNEVDEDRVEYEAPYQPDTDIAQVEDQPLYDTKKIFEANNEVDKVEDEVSHEPDSVKAQEKDDDLDDTKKISEVNIEEDKTQVENEVPDQSDTEKDQEMDESLHDTSKLTDTKNEMDKVRAEHEVFYQPEPEKDQRKDEALDGTRKISEANNEVEKPQVEHEAADQPDPEKDQENDEALDDTRKIAEASKETDRLEARNILTQQSDVDISQQNELPLADTEKKNILEGNNELNKPQAESKVLQQSATETAHTQPIQEALVDTEFKNSVADNKLQTSEAENEGHQKCDSEKVLETERVLADMAKKIAEANSELVRVQMEKEKALADIKIAEANSELVRVQMEKEKALVDMKKISEVNSEYTPQAEHTAHREQHQLDTENKPNSQQYKHESENRVPQQCDVATEIERALADIKTKFQIDSKPTKIVYINKQINYYGYQKPGTESGLEETSSDDDNSYNSRLTGHKKSRSRSVSQSRTKTRSRSKSRICERTDSPCRTGIFDEIQDSLSEITVAVTTIVRMLQKPNTDVYEERKWRSRPISWSRGKTCARPSLHDRISTERITEFLLKIAEQVSNVVRLLQQPDVKVNKGVVQQTLFLLNQLLDHIRTDNNTMDNDLPTLRLEKVRVQLKEAMRELEKQMMKGKGFTGRKREYRFDATPNHDLGLGYGTSCLPTLRLEKVAVQLEEATTEFEKAMGERFTGRKREYQFDATPEHDLGLGYGTSRITQTKQSAEARLIPEYPAWTTKVEENSNDQLQTEVSVTNLQPHTQASETMLTMLRQYESRPAPSVYRSTDSSILDTYSQVGSYRNVPGHHTENNVTMTSESTDRHMTSIQTDTRPTSTSVSRCIQPARVETQITSSDKCLSGEVARVGYVTQPSNTFTQIKDQSPLTSQPSGRDATFCKDHDTNIRPELVLDTQTPAKIQMIVSKMPSKYPDLETTPVKLLPSYSITQIKTADVKQNLATSEPRSLSVTPPQMYESKTRDVSVMAATQTAEEPSETCTSDRHIKHSGRDYVKHNPLKSHLLNAHPMNNKRHLASQHDHQTSMSNLMHHTNSTRKDVTQVEPTNNKVYTTFQKLFIKTEQPFRKLQVDPKHRCYYTDLFSADQSIKDKKATSSRTTRNDEMTKASPGLARITEETLVPKTETKKRGWKKMGWLKKLKQMFRIPRKGKDKNYVVA